MTKLTNLWTRCCKVQLTTEQMNAAQHKLYIRRWTAVARCNRWQMRRGRLDDGAVGPERSEQHAAVWRAAKLLAEKDHRAVGAEHLRHACHIVAFGLQKSSKFLTNDQFSRLLILWGNEKEKWKGALVGLLIDPEDLMGLQAWADPGEERRRQYIRFLEARRREAVLIAITKCRWETSDWRARNLTELLWLGRESDRQSDAPF